MTIRHHFTGKFPSGHRERYAAAAALSYTPLFTARQVHGAEVAVLDKDYRFPGLDDFIASQPSADAVVTNQPGLYIAVKTADCVPILLWDVTAGVVAAVHAGWKGTALEIVCKAAKTMCQDFGAQPQCIHAAIGPCVCGDCYETGAEVPAAMPSLAAPHIRDKGASKYLVDLPAINAALLRNMGINHIQTPEACTACRSDLYWSHRRHGTNRGLQLSIIGISPKGGASP